MVQILFCTEMANYGGLAIKIETNGATETGNIEKW